MNQGQGQLDKRQNVEHNSIYHHTMFESNPFVNVQLPANIKVLWHSQ